MLATVKPRTLVGMTIRRMAAEEIADLVAVDAKLKAIKKELRDRCHRAGLAPDGPVRCRSRRRRPDPRRRRGRGPVPRPQPLRVLDRHRTLDASSGEQIRHRLSRAGNRRTNHVLHVAAIVQIRHDTEGRAYHRRKLAESKTAMEALRCLKRRLSVAVYRQLVADAQASDEAGPGGHSGASSQSSAADLCTRSSALRISHFPDPQPRRYPRARPLRRPPRSRLPAPRDDAQEPSRCSAPPDERP